MAKLRVYDKNGIPSKEWARFDTLFGDVLKLGRNIDPTNNNNDNFLLALDRMRWDQILPGILCVVLDDTECLLNDTDLSLALNKGIAECIADGICDGAQGRMKLCRSVEKTIDTLTLEVRPYTVITRITQPTLASWPQPLTYDGLAFSSSANGDHLPPLPASIYEPTAHRQHSFWTGSTRPFAEVRLTSFSAHEAVARAERFIDIIRAFVSIHVLRGNTSLQLEGLREKPIGPLISGPLYLVSEDGLKTFRNDLWWTTGYPSNDSTERITSRADTLFYFITGCFNQLAALPYKTELENLLIRYASAIHETRWSLTLLGLWSILEKITNCVGKEQERMAGRSVRLLAGDRTLRRHLLECARTTRNRIVHAGEGAGINEQWAMSVQPIVELHLLNLLSNTLSLKAITEYSMVLNLSEDHRFLANEVKLRASLIERENGASR